jgi:ferredoxin--NADP+ reductase
MNNNKVNVTDVTHYTDRLFKFRTTRPKTFRFKAGEFVLIGIDHWSEKLQRNKPIMRAYSMSSGPYDDELEFYSIKVPNGPLTSKLQHIKIGDELILGKRATGTLVTSSITLGGNLWLMGTGTGIAPFMSLLRDPEIYEQFDNIYLTWTTRTHEEQEAFAPILETGIHDCTYIPTFTQESMLNEEGLVQKYQGRITNLIKDGTVFSEATPENDKVMLCGSMEFNLEMKEYLEERGWEEGSRKSMGTFVLEKAFVR